MPSPASLRRLANLTKKVHDDLRRGGMAMTFRYLFRSTAILARVVAILADHVATEAEQERAERGAAAAERRGAIRRPTARAAAGEISRAAGSARVGSPHGGARS
jgi:hypothetical protein